MNATEWTVVCPKCNAASVVDSLGLATCATCAQVFEVTPPPPVVKTKPQKLVPIPEMLEPGVLYRDSEILVQNNQINLGGKIFSPRNIASISSEIRAPKRKTEAILLLFVLVALARALEGQSLNANDAVNRWVWLTVWVAAMAGVWFCKKAKYVILLDTSAGRQEGGVFNDHERAMRVFIAIKQAISEAK